MPDNGGNEKATFHAEHFFAGIRGLQMMESFHGGTDKNGFLTNEIGVVLVVIGPCSASTIFCINTAISAQKDDEEDEDALMGICAADAQVDFLFACFY